MGGSSIPVAGTDSLTGPGTDSITSALTASITIVACSLALIVLLAALRRSRPEFRVMPIVWGAFALRVLAAILVHVSTGGTLYGPDQLTFLQDAAGLSIVPLLSGAWGSTAIHSLQTVVFASQIKLLHPSALGLHFTQIGLSTAGLVLLAASVYDLAGPRAAVVAALVLAVEPTNVFFSAIIQKDPLVYLGECLVVFGGTRQWLRGGAAGMASIAAGILIALATRYYVGWILIIAALAIGLHGALRVTTRNPIRGNVTIAAFVVALLIVLPVVVSKATSSKTIADLQASQNYNASAHSGNLDFGRINFSSPADIVLHVPTRMADVLTRPYPWELANTSQRLGLLGTIVIVVSLCYFIRLVLRARLRVFAWGGPLLYTAGFMFFAYSVAAGNGGTSFRYRAHVLALFICLVVVLRARLAGEWGWERGTTHRGPPVARSLALGSRPRRCALPEGTA